MFESLVLGLVQGIAEWLPVSSEAMIVLVKNNFFPDGMAFSEILSYAIFLHMGTFLAVLVFYFKKIKKLIFQLLTYPRQGKETQLFLNFIIIATFVSGGLGYFLLKFVEKNNAFFQNESLINLFVASFLLVTAVFLFIGEKQQIRLSKKTPLTHKKAFITGIFQGLAAIPGISRSGSTVAGMALLGIEKKQALEMSFLLSLPLVFFANIVLNGKMFLNLQVSHLLALVAAFVSGILTIKALLLFVQKVRFSFFVAGFSLILFLFTFLH